MSQSLISHTQGARSIWKMRGQQKLDSPSVNCLSTLTVGMSIVIFTVKVFSYSWPSPNRVGGSVYVHTSSSPSHYSSQVAAVYGWPQAGGAENSLAAVTNWIAWGTSKESWCWSSNRPSSFLLKTHLSNSVVPAPLERSQSKRLAQWVHHTGQSFH